jgi:hypothetical protein
MILDLFSNNNKQKHFLFPHKKKQIFLQWGQLEQIFFCEDVHGLATIEGPE